MQHKHANAMLEYAMDALQTDAPWQRWEYRDNEGSYWRQPGSHPCWFEDFEYRRKPNQEQLDVEAFNKWRVYEDYSFSCAAEISWKAWTAALAWERSKK